MTTQARRRHKPKLLYRRGHHIKKCTVCGAERLIWHGKLLNQWHDTRHGQWNLVPWCPGKQEPAPKSP